MVDGAKSVSLLRMIKDRWYVDLAATTTSTSNDLNTSHDVSELIDTEPRDETVDPSMKETQPGRPAQDERRKRVFITHGQNTSFLEPIKELLSFGELEPVVSVEQQTVSKPVPDKVLMDMRRCGAAIIHVDADRVLLDQEAKEHNLLNENVLIEIGAAMALYGRRFILLVKQGVRLPSNLQGLYEVRYEGEQPDGPATIRLLKAINDIKNNPLPEES